MDGERHKLNQIGVRCRSARVGDRQRLALFEQQLRQILHRAGNHQPCIRQVESLRHRPRKIERLRDNHFAGGLREIERDVVAKHTIIIRPGNME